MSHIEHFAQPFSKGKNHAVIKDIAQGICSTFGLDTSQCLDSWLKGCAPPLYRLSYKEERDPRAIIGKRLFNALFEKNRSIGGLSPDEREAASFDKWLKSEEQCRETNKRFRFGASGHSPELETLIFLVSRKITSILGPCPSFSELPFGFGPGANVGVSRLTSVRRKLSVRPTLSANAVPYLSTLQASHPFWPMQQHEIQNGRLTFVPKSAVVDRAIVIEPIVNTYVQKGIGSYIRSQLRRAGIDLDNQDVNRDFARFGSITDLVSTVDLSSASDTISFNVVAELLPYDWLSLLSSFRTPVVRYNGVDYRLHKFSSMGNGYTFELESLIFFAICSVVCQGSRFVNVFGDDIIVPSRYYDEVTKALTSFGFSVNLEKSYSDGPFRESCGKDFWKGIDVRPCYVKATLSFKELFRYHNFCKRNGYDKLADIVLRHIPSQLQHFTGPDGFGDGHLIGDWSPQRRFRERGWSLFGFRTISTSPNRQKGRLRGDYAAFLYGSANSGLSGGTLLHASQKDARESTPCNSDIIWSDSMYQERGSNKYRITRIYTWTL